MSPKMMLIAIGELASKPAPLLSARGSMANIMAKVVIKTALKRFFAAIFTASFASIPLFAK